MRIAIDASAIGPFPSGARTRMLALLEAYARDVRNHRLVVFLRRDAELATRFDAVGIECIEVPPPPPPVIRLLRGTGVWRARLAAARADAFSAETLPPPGDVGVPMAVTIHDLRDLASSSPVPSARRFYARHLLPRALRRVQRVIAVSEWTGGEIVRRLGVSTERVSVVANGVDAATVGVDAGAARGWRRGRGVADRYVLALGHLERRKNLGLLVDAVREIRSTGHGDLGLVFAGRDETGEGDRLRRRAAAAPAVPLVTTGPLDDVTRRIALAGAVVVATPSTLEGFGLVPLEGMAAGVPTVSSAAAALPEVVGDAGILVEPHDVSGWARAIAGLLDGGAERERLIDAGRARAATFTWERAAQQLARAHEALLAGA